jgi:CBS domain-containing protein
MSETLIPNIESFIANIDPFSRLPETLRQKVSATIKIVYLAKEEVIPPPSSKQDNYLFIVKTGAVEQRCIDGSLRGRLEEDDVFGFSLFSKSEARYQIEAIENTLLYLVPAKTIYYIQSHYPEYAQHFTAKPEGRIHSAIESSWSDINNNSFFNRVDQVASKQFVKVNSDASIVQAAKIMRDNDASCLIVAKNNQLVGIVTCTDLIGRVIAEEKNTQLPVSDFMSPLPSTISPQSSAFDAAICMMENNIQNLPIVEQGQVVGLLSLNQLFKNQRLEAIYLINKIKKSCHESELAKYMPERDQIFQALVTEKVPADLISTILSTIMDAVNQRLIEIAIGRLGPVPCDFSWIVAGSQARKEAHISSDQDSAIILSNQATTKDKVYFRHLAMLVTKGMDLCGYELCTGKFMAVTAKWCQPLSVWQEYYKKWIRNPEYECLLNLSVFLDTRVIYGNKQYRITLINDFKEMLSSRHFLSKLVRDAAENRTPLGIFHNLVLTKNENNESMLNIKRYAINIIVDLSRIYALAAKTDACNTTARLIAVNKAGLIDNATLKNIISAYNFLNNFRFSYQVNMINKGEIPSSQINPDYFGSFERKHIKDAFRLIDDWQQYTKMRFS